MIRERAIKGMPRLNTKTNFRCGICTKEFGLDYALFTTVNHKLTVCCTKCQDRDFGTCKCCDTRMPIFDLSEIKVKGKNTSVCRGCRTTLYVSCHDCGNFDLIKDSKKFNGNRWYCSTCTKQYHECTGCHGAFKGNQLVDTLCNRCMQGMVKGYHTKIDQIIPDYLMRDEDGRKSFYNKGVPGHALLPRGDNTSIMQNASSQGAERFFGVELEVEYDYNSKLDRNRAAKRVYDCFPRPFIVIKHDSSLKDQGQGGFEIVSAPATYKRHIKEWEQLFATYPEKSLLSSYFTDHCGMHIHVSRASLSTLQIGKIVSFICHPNNRKFIRQIAQRQSNKYNNFTIAKKVSDIPFYKKTGMHKPAWIAQEQHHTAVDINHEQTIEIRIFKGTLKKEAFFKNIEFVAALCDWCETGIASVCDVGDVDKFCQFVEKYAKQYPNLFAFLVERGYCKAKGKLTQKKRRRRRTKVADVKATAEHMPHIFPAAQAPPMEAGNLGVDIAALEAQYAGVIGNVGIDDEINYFADPLGFNLNLE
jgi:hypothetical protein